MEELRKTLGPEAFEKINAAEPLVEVWLTHGPSESWELPPDLESRGTNVLLARLHDLLHVLRDGGLLILDELDTSLHPDLCAALVALFTSASTNPMGAQLLFTTHDRSLLAGLRRDEVVLIDKDAAGESTVRTASDFRGLRGRDDLRREHEQVRIGGVPVLGDFAREFERLREHRA